MADGKDSFDSAEATGAESRSADLVAERILYEEFPSTQDEARRLLQAGGAPLPFLVQALRQTAGRGRGGNRWSGGEGALTFTLVFDPAEFGLAPGRLATLSIATALAVCESLQRHSRGEPLGIKWPNDVYAAGRKLCGILIETILRPAGGAPAVLVGVGVNVDNDVPASAVEGRAPAINLAELAGAPIGGASHGFRPLLTDLLATLQREYRALAAGEADQIRRWNGRNVLRGRRCRIERPGIAGPLEGVADAIDSEGALTLITEQGPTTIRSGSVVAW